jgi:hypothetical protein
MEEQNSEDSSIFAADLARFYYFVYVIVILPGLRESLKIRPFSLEGQGV